MSSRLTIDSIAEYDPQVGGAIFGERARQVSGVEMIPSENYTYPEVLAALGSVLTNKYSEGYPGRRYYGGQEFTDTIERLACDTAGHVSAGQLDCGRIDGAGRLDLFRVRCCFSQNLLPAFSGSRYRVKARITSMTTANLFSVEGYAVIVTGGASGIGLGYTEALASRGARVTMLDVHAERIEMETRRLRDLGMDVAGRVVDVTDHKSLDSAFAEIADGYGRLDVVFANAGIDSGTGFVGAWVGSDRPRVMEGALEHYSDERWAKVIAINLDGVFATCRAAARHMRPRKRGRIIITTSAASSRIEPAIGAAYMASKAGAAHFMKTVALELAAYNITVNAIAPGLFVTNIGGGHAKSKEVQDAFSKVVPMHRCGFPEDMYGLALFLASSASSYVTGQEIIIDGGLVLGQAD